MFRRLLAAFRHDERRLQAGYALANAFSGWNQPTAVTITHAQVIDRSGAVRLYTSDGEYRVTLERVGG